jgi:hypothetical protein
MLIDRKYSLVALNCRQISIQNSPSPECPIVRTLIPIRMNPYAAADYEER